MSDTHEKGAFQADIPSEAVAEALRSVERVQEGSQPEETEVVVEAGAADPAALADLLDRLRSLEAQLELSQTKSRETLDKLREEHDRHLRAVADLENYRKRAAREREDIQKFGNEKLLKELFPVMDNLDRALAAAAEDDPLRKGVEMVRSSFEQALSRHGVKAFSAMGQPFDPALHEALMQVVNADQPPGTVVLEHARGFLLNERLVRPAMVGVSIAPPPAPAEEAAGSGGNG